MLHHPVQTPYCLTGAPPLKGIPDRRRLAVTSQLKRIAVAKEWGRIVGAHWARFLPPQNPRSAPNHLAAPSLISPQVPNAQAVPFVFGVRKADVRRFGRSLLIFALDLASRFPVRRLRQAWAGRFGH